MNRKEVFEYMDAENARAVPEMKAIIQQELEILLNQMRYSFQDYFLDEAISVKSFKHIEARADDPEDGVRWCQGLVDTAIAEWFNDIKE